VCAKAVPEAYIEPTVKALVKHDLSLIPLLHDREQLDAKIAETLGVLHEDPELNMNLGIGQPGRNPSVLMPSSDEVARLRTEIERIDPMDVDEIMGILLTNLSLDAVHHSLTNRRFLAIKYSAAKKEVIRQQEEQCLTMRSTPTDASDRVQPPQSSDPPPRPPPDAEALHDNLELRALAALSNRDILTKLSGLDGDALCGRLGIARPMFQDVSANKRWTQAVMAKPTLATRNEIRKQLMQKLDVSDQDPSGPPLRNPRHPQTIVLKRSQLSTVVRQLMDEEDEKEAICEL
jgi:hypothetical protein